MDADAIAQLLVEVADELIVPRLARLSSDEIDQKRPGDLVTIADREAEAAIGDALRRARPDALVVGEEGTFADPHALDGLADADVAFVIDPIDGTRNFAAGTPDFGVMLAEVHAGEPVRSWIWQAAHQVMYIGERGAGVTRNGERLAPAPDRERPYAAAVHKRFRGGGDPDLAFEWTRGACAVDYPRLMEGEVDALVYPSQHPWDHLPGVLMLRELGGEAALDGADRVWGVGQYGRFLLVGADADVLAVLQEHAARLPS